MSSASPRSPEGVREAEEQAFVITESQTKDATLPEQCQGLVPIEERPVENDIDFDLTDQNRPESSPYSVVSNKIYTLQMGMEKAKFLVPASLVNRHPKLSRSVKKVATEWKLEMPTIEGDIGHTLVHHLYTGAYQTLRKSGLSYDEVMAVEYRRSVFVYVAAKVYEIESLASQAVQKMDMLAPKVSIYKMLEVTSEAYSQFRRDDEGMLGHVRCRLESAFAADMSIVTQDRFLDSVSDVIFNKVMMRVMVDIYTTKLAAVNAREEELTKVASTKSISKENAQGHLKSHESAISVCRNELAGTNESAEEPSKCQVPPEIPCKSEQAFATDYEPLLLGSAPIDMAERAELNCVTTQVPLIETNQVSRTENSDMQYPPHNGYTLQAPIPEQPVANSEPSSIQKSTESDPIQKKKTKKNRCGSCGVKTKKVKCSKCLREAKRDEELAQTAIEQHKDTMVESTSKLFNKAADEFFGSTKVQAVDNRITEPINTLMQQQIEYPVATSSSTAPEEAVFEVIEQGDTLGASDGSKWSSSSPSSEAVFTPPPSEPTEVDRICQSRAQHLLEGDGWKHCVLCRTMVHQVILQVARRSNSVENEYEIVDRTMSG